MMLESTIVGAKAPPLMMMHAPGRVMVAIHGSVVVSRTWCCVASMMALCVMPAMPWFERAGCSRGDSSPRGDGSLGNAYKSSHEDYEYIGIGIAITALSHAVSGIARDVCSRNEMLAAFAARVR